MTEPIKIVLEVNLNDKPEWTEDFFLFSEQEEYENMTSEDVFKHCLGVLLEQSIWDEDTIWHCTNMLGSLCDSDFNILTN
tara:strand:- start:310 stop:549 length:240 start_codon:yes stop_codon:yes gene_type:complete